MTGISCSFPGLITTLDVNGDGYPGDISYVFGAISDREPFITMANLRDDGGEVSPQVYAPVLEPSTLLLLGSGLAGLVVFRKRLKGKGL